VVNWAWAHAECSFRYGEIVEGTEIRNNLENQDGGGFRCFVMVRMFRRGIGREVGVVGIFFKVGKISCEIFQSLAEF